eukprot:CAMPEP_0119129344 /NCGR_PEP_ID=MMETSP1310-20130426/7135_1 /TAXON_ID=464262 /ORGANISM="Genus nov. species nov., Strain RCC2339" /LENGTH=208 /DNA_ID=CAMNT_0007119763 /DNA_START=389 /DNA_END=1015 /DNA_ORIENTATION=-
MGWSKWGYGVVGLSAAGGILSAYLSWERWHTLPAEFPIHFDAWGDADWLVPKEWGVPLVPALMIATGIISVWTVERDAQISGKDTLAPLAVVAATCGPFAVALHELMLDAAVVQPVPNIDIAAVFTNMGLLFAFNGAVLLLLNRPSAREDPSALQRRRVRNLGSAVFVASGACVVGVSKTFEPGVGLVVAGVGAMMTGGIVSGILLSW